MALGLGFNASHDEELVQAILAGKGDAFATLVQRYFGLVYAIALAGVGRRETAEDLTQETFARAYLGLARLKNPAALPAWLSLIARNMAVDWRRRDQRASTFLSLIDADVESLEIPDDRLIPASRRMEMDESNAALHEALTRLPLEQREALLLSFMEGLGQREIARVMGRSPAKISRMIKQALGNMRATLEERTRQELALMRAGPRAQARALGLIAALAALPMAAKASMAAASAQALHALAVSAAPQMGGGLFGWLKAIHIFYTTGGKTVIAIKSLATLMATLAVIGTGVTLTRSLSADERPAAIPPGARVIHFPKDRVLGRVSIDKRHYGNPYYMCKGNYGCWDEYEWEYLDEARGDVVIPAGKLVQLSVAPPQVFEGLAPLAQLGPDDIHHLIIGYDYGMGNVTLPPGFDPDSLMPPLAGLKGLKVLDLRFTKIGDQGLRVLRNFTALERLKTPDGLTGPGLAIVCGLKSLKGLYTYCPANGEGLPRLIQLPRLEELQLSGPNVDDYALASLSSLPALKLLMTGGERVTDRAMAALNRIPNLRTLDINGPFTDRGLALLAASPSIEDLDLYHCDQFTDDGVANLKTMRSLKSVNLWCARSLTDRAAESLSEIKTLESVGLAVDNMTDQALIALARLPRLKHAFFSVVWLSDPGEPVNKIIFTERGLAALAATAPTLKELQIGGQGVNDAALAQIAKMTNLTELKLIPLLTATNAGLARLKTLKALEGLCIMNCSDAVTIAGLKQMGALSQLKIFQADDIVQDDSGLDLSGMPNLEWLFLRLRNFQSLRDEDLASLAGMRQIKWLLLERYNELLTDRALAHLSGLNTLSTRLSIGGAKLTDEGMKHFVGMQKLHELMVRGKIGDAGLGQIAKLRALDTLEVNTSAMFTPDGMDRIQAGLPFLAHPLIGPERVINAGGQQMRLPGEDAPDITAKTLDGKDFQLSKLGKVMLLHFWATWQRPSAEDLARLKKIHETLNKKHGDRVMVLSLALDNNDAAWREFVKREGMDWPQARLHVQSSAAYNYGLKMIPACFLLEPSGKVLLNPESSWKDLYAVVDRALAGGGGPNQ